MTNCQATFRAQPSFTLHKNGLIKMFLCKIAVKPTIHENLAVIKALLGKF